MGWKVFRKIGGCTGNDSHDSHISTSHAVEIALGEAVILKVSTSEAISSPPVGRELLSFASVAS